MNLDFKTVTGATDATVLIDAVTLTSAPVVPTPTTGEPTVVTSTSAYVSGVVSTNGSGFTTTLFMDWGPTPELGNVETMFTTEGGTLQAVALLKNLAPGTTYYYRARATNAIGSSAVGVTRSVTTPADRPSVAAVSATNITTTSAELRGTVVANGASTDVTFSYGLSASYNVIVPAVPSPVTGTAATPVSSVISGLAPHTTYHYRIFATNANGAIAGSDETFTTLNNAPVNGAPLELNFGATSTFDFDVSPLFTDPDGDALTITLFSLGNPVGVTLTQVGSSTFRATVTQPLYGGQVSAIFQATDGFGGVAFGGVQIRDVTKPVITPSGTLPTVIAGPGGTVPLPDFRNAFTADDNMGVTSFTQSPAPGTEVGAGSMTLTLTATDDSGNSTTAQFGITVGVPLPIATTRAAEQITAKRALLAGQIENPSGGPVAVSFIYGPTNPPTQETTVESLGSGTSMLLNRYIQGLQPGREYFFRIKASNASGAVLGEVHSFSTTAAPTGDKSAPLVRITAPRAGKVSGAFEIVGTVRENKELASFSVYLNGVALPLEADPLGNQSAFTPNTDVPWRVVGVMPENGANTIVVEAVDAAGKRTAIPRTVTYVNIRPELSGTYQALLLPHGTVSIDTIGLVTVSLTPTGTFTGKATIGSANVRFTGVLKNDGAARFKSTGTSAYLMPRGDSSPLSLAFDVSDSQGLSGTLSATGAEEGRLAAFASKVAPYGPRKLVSSDPLAAGFLNQPSTGLATKGVYALVFAAKEQEPAIGAAIYPQGYGIAHLSLSDVGVVKLSGNLADGTIYHASGLLRADGTAPFFTSLYGKRGGFAGELVFANLTDSDASGANFLWLRPGMTKAPHYPSGWPNGVGVDAVATKHSNPGSLNFGQGTADPTNGNATLSFTGGLLSSAVDEAVSVDPTSGGVKAIPTARADYKLRLTAKTGLFSGTFTEDTGKQAAFRGILLNKGANRGGFGYFLSGPPADGSVSGKGGKVTLAP